ncbi:MULTISPECIES: sodium/glutamate symporter [Acinetobacter]|jgi:ESS family glutamate:Na+ symporter|uniref:Sodium/glutamate symporter n=1 Tax=Acinetobacter johnsonii TaxID=40214 RepID=A0AAW6RM96_ACIJO|nr:MULTISPECIES: sodium/glutamate symporter [Acinetobacter]MBO7706968.1 sodium/glutamate symporter [Acinetobacter sp.]MCM5532954.1 sodium/glutamate symporter [Acinetobacter pittii]MCV2452405.1 sodium/glutamate symporter [Acinetobacter johnsonii]MDG9785831.1 sodium/glutamate symporter [Acinetobacter johnsonii]MDG9799667.1 sodium/glutamate symporter [Acinetobacter johnsonii]
MNYQFDAFMTIVAAVAVLLVGYVFVNKVSILKKYNIPEPVAGGLVAAVITYILFKGSNITVNFDTNIQQIFMLMFFTSVGLSASLVKLKEGGKSLLIFLVCVIVFVLLQNVVGISLAKVLGLDPLIGLITGSVTLTGGHGTAGAWGTIFEQEHGVHGAIVLGMASATFGLIIGGVIGGPIAKFLIRRYQLAEEIPAATGRNEAPPSAQTAPFEFPEKTRLITADDAVKTMGMFAICISFAYFMTGVAKGQWFELPSFVWALMCGVVLRNILEHGLKVQVFDRCIDVFGNASLALFLAMALMSLQLWLLADLAGPLVIILIVQTIFLALYLYFVTFRVMGKNYDAAVLCAGQCGVNLGATPTAIANIQAVTNTYGPSHKAFLIIPLTGAFFVDIVNAFVIQLSIGILG